MKDPPCHKKIPHATAQTQHSHIKKKKKVGFENFKTMPLKIMQYVPFYDLM